ncbi:hypothetical protein [Streptomyces macrosporus]|uniref:HEAT repeat domain-containing protein n=1 Tax=Streptomyces macrosporus TaxID=44032 RepID=A0ABN3KAR2_9ACTN
MEQDAPEHAGALRDAASPSWSVRASAGRRLAAHADAPTAAEALHHLLLDAYDTAVTQETAEALLGRGDTTGLRLVLAALGRAEDAETGDHLYAAVTDVCCQSAEDVRRLAALCSTLAASDPDPVVRAEAEGLLRDFGPADR